MIDCYAKKLWVAKLRKQLIDTLPNRIVIDHDRGASVEKMVVFINKKWEVKYFFTYPNGRTESFIFVRSRSLFKAVRKAHKKALSLCLDTLPC